MKVLIIGTGFLGTKIYYFLNSKNKYDIVCSYFTQKEPNFIYLDITNSKNVKTIFENIQPSIVILTAAMADPCSCEINQNLSKNINVKGVSHVVDECKKYNCKLIYISTVYVFDGVKGNYSEIDKCNPINFYGSTKVEAEKVVKILKKYVILRFDILYGFNSLKSKNGFFSKVINGNGYKVNNDQKRQPLLVDDVASAIFKIIEDDLYGIFHLGGSENISKYELALKLETIVRDQGKKSEIIGVPESKMIARRPKDVSLNVQKALSFGMIFHNINESCKIIKKQYNSQK